MRCENDSLEQYTRRETVRTLGLPEEPLEQKVLKMFDEAGAGVKLKAEDISTVHTTGKKRQGVPGRAVLVKFVSLKSKRKVMTTKKQLREKPDHSKVFINDDLTRLRSKLLPYAKETGKPDNVWVTEGRIWCTLKRPPGLAVGSNRPICIGNPDDLFKLGIDCVDFNKLGLAGLVYNPDII
nr:hypothetical protein BaRGS_000142 [Batillaria attramentaria]